VLVIDDEVIVGQAVKRILARHDVIAVEGAGEALALLGRGDRFDVVLCDLIMPEATGMDFLAEVQRTYPKVADRVVFMTGGAFTPAARAFVDRVKNPCLAKPFNLQRLCDLVDGFVV
jgi:DNA-binding NtrC family response regulator